MPSMDKDLVSIGDRGFRKCTQCCKGKAQQGCSGYNQCIELRLTSLEHLIDRSKQWI